jgi:hypothetical protein
VQQERELASCASRVLVALMCMAHAITQQTCEREQHRRDHP